jgi:hypothetical protein
MALNLPLSPMHGAVYNRDNRSKVEKDEAEAQKEEEAAREKHENAEREYRRQLLLQRRATGAEAGPSSSPSALVAALEAGPMQAAAQQAVVAAPAAQQQVQHVNFWSEDEARLKAEHPDVAVSALAACAMHACSHWFAPCATSLTRAACWPGSTG